MSDKVDTTQKEKEQKESKNDKTDMKEQILNKAETKPTKDQPNKSKKITLILKRNPTNSIQIPSIEIVLRYTTKVPKIISRNQILLSYKTQIPKKELLNHILKMTQIEKQLWKVVISTLKSEGEYNNFVYLKANPSQLFIIRKIDDLIIQQQVVPVTYYNAKGIKTFVEKYLIQNDPSTLQYDNIMKTIDINRQTECQNKSELKFQEFLRKSTLVYLYCQDIIAREYLQKPILPYEVWKKKQKTHSGEVSS